MRIIITSRIEHKNKKALSQMDWVISLALFIIFIAWFFSFIIPKVYTVPKLTSRLDYIDKQFYTENRWRIEKIPIFVYSNKSHSPIFLNFSENAYTNLPYIRIGKRLIFLANSSLNWIFVGGNYTQDNVSATDFNVEQNWINSANMSLRFSNGMPYSAYYKEKERIREIQYYLNGQEFEVTSNSNGENLLIVYKAASNLNLNHTTIVFAYLPEYYNLITLEDETSTYLLNITLSLDKYTRYYSDNSHFGDFLYLNDSTTVNYTHNYVTFYDSSNGVSLFFDSNVDFIFTNYNDTLTAQIISQVYDNYIYKVIFHDGNYTRSILTDTKIGFAQKLEGINLDNLTHPETGNMDFYIKIYKQGSLYKEIGNITQKRLISKTSIRNSLDKYGNLIPLRIVYMVSQK